MGNTEFSVTGRKRDRVRGPGPDRTELPLFHKVGALPPSLIDSCFELLMSQTANDLQNPETYKIKDYCAHLMEMLPPGFTHLLLQEASAETDAIEAKYRLWKPFLDGHPLRAWLEENFPGLYRARLSVLRPGTTFDWHIDANTSVGCRCSIVLNNEDAIFEIKRRGQVERMRARIGDVIFTNTGWPHRVTNPTSKDRTNLVFGVDYSTLAHVLPRLTTYSPSQSETPPLTTSVDGQPVLY